MFLRTLTTFACTAVLAIAGHAQSTPMPNHMQMGDKPAAKSNKPLASPAATATVTLNGKAITVDYHTPSMRGRKIAGELVPYGKVWRTGANEATTLTTAGDLKIGDLSVPAGTYTLFTLPNADQWLLIVNKLTGEWGLAYDESKDLGRVPMQSHTLPSPQEKMSISFERTRGNTTELHVQWDTIDQYVTITAE